MIMKIHPIYSCIKKGNISKMTGRVEELADALKTEVTGKGI